MDEDSWLLDRGGKEVSEELIKEEGRGSFEEVCWLERSGDDVSFPEILQEVMSMLAAKKRKVWLKFFFIFYPFDGTLVP